MNEKKEVNVLFIGGTGHGKSFFLNMFEQVAVHPDLDQAAENISDCAVPIRFFHGVDYVTEAIFDQNQLGGSISLTPLPTVCEYQTSYGILRLIDTPGIGDTSGSDWDEKHLNNIISCMIKYDKIHGILLFFKNSDNRFDFKIKYQLCELLSFLGKSAVDNIQFVITHVGLHNDIGDAGGVIKDFDKLLPVKIPFTRDNTFCFENDPLKYLILKKQGKSSYSEESHSIFKITYNRNRKEYVRLFKKVCNCETPYDVNQYRALAMARQLWPNLSLQFSEVDVVKAVIRRAVHEERSEREAFLQYLAMLEVNLEKTKSVFECAVETFRQIFGGPTASGTEGSLLTRGAITFAASTAAGAALSQAVALPIAAVAGATVAAAFAPALAAGGALGALMATGAYTINHLETKYERQETSKKIEETHLALKAAKGYQEQYEQFIKENEQVKQLEKDFARCLYHNAILAYTVAKEEYVKNEMSCVKSYGETQILEQKKEQLVKEKAIFQQVVENENEGQNLLSPQDLLNEVEAMYELTYYGKPIREAIERSKIKNQEQFNVIIRSEIAVGYLFHEIYSIG